MSATVPSLAPSRCCWPAGAWSARPRESSTCSCAELAALERFLDPVEDQDAGTSGWARVSRLPGVDRAQMPGEEDGAEMGANMRAVAPPVQSFASGRRR